jgi:hypothetical protein
MPGKGTLERHGDLMAHMATKVGADLDEAELRGELAPELRQDMLLSCTACSNPTACAKWLDEAAEGSAPPAYCRNRDILLDLAAE